MVFVIDNVKLGVCTLSFYFYIYKYKYIYVKMKNLNIFSLVAEYENAKLGGVLDVPNVSFVDEDSSVRYLLKNIPTHNGHEYVDLGLPSGLKWATCNVGASNPQDYGLYFAWGETVGYTAEQVPGVRAFNSASYKASAISADLTLEQDAAHVNLGGNWRMPTKAEYQELLDNCDDSWTDNYNGTGVAGRVFTSKVNENSVFFPAAGDCYDSSVNNVGSVQYWSASWNSSSEAWFLDFQLKWFGIRFYGLSVRGVFK